MDFSQPQKVDSNPVDLRKFGDNATTRKAIYDNALQAVTSMPAAENSRYRLTLTNPQYSGADEYSPAEHKKSLLHGKSLTKKISGTLNLHDLATGQLVDTKTLSLGNIPHLTDHGTFSLDGIPSAMSSQFRLLPGVYVRRKDNDEVEGHVVHFPGEGVSHRIRLDQGTGVFKIDVGQAEIPAAAALKAFGMNEADLTKAVGEHLAKVNIEAVKPHHLDKLYEKFGPKNKPDADEAAKVAAVAKAMAGKIDPWVVNKTLGIKGDTYGPGMFLATLKKTLAVARGEQEPDDRDSPAFQAVWGPEHLIAERITRSRALGDALWRATNSGSLKGILPGMLNQHIKALFMSSGLAQMPEGVSAAEYLDHGSRISKIGEGGLGRSSDAVPKSSRNLSPGQFLFVDPVKTPECFDAETEVLTHAGWKKWPDVVEDDLLACRIGKKTEFRKPHRTHSYDFDGHLVGCDEGLVRFLVTGNHRMWLCQFDTSWRFSNASEAYGIAAVYDSSLDSTPVSQYVPGNAWKRVKYRGRVYCATVEGGLLFCRRNSGVGFWSGNSESVGVDLRVAFGTRLGNDKRIYAPVRDASSGKLVYRSPQQLADSSIAFPVTYEEAGPNDPVPAIVNGKLSYVKKREVSYVAPSMEQSFSPLSNMVPYKSSAKPQRVSMGARFISQALPLSNSEAPLVRSAVPGDPNKSFEELYGKYMGTAWAKPDAGTVVSVDPDTITVKYDKLGRVEHGVYNNLPIGRKSPLHSTATVKVGDRITPGSMLARSNFTDDKGHAAYGLNARVAFYPFLRSKPTYEDAFNVSESFAKRATSDHLYRHDLDYSDDSIIPTKSAFVAAFPTALERSKLKDYDETGAILPGTKVEPGQPLALAVRRRAPEFGLSKGRKSGLTDASLIWDDSVPGVVADVAKTRSGLVVTVKASKPLKEADKISNRFGGKGVVNIIPDSEMPVGEDGKPFEVLISPLAMTTRINPSMKVETALGKLAAMTGKPIIASDFRSGQDNAREAFDKLRAAGISPTEMVTDPKTGKSVKAFTGTSYILKLHHMADDKVKARGLGGYDDAGLPMRGQSGKAARMSMGDTMALLGHGACFMGCVNVTTRDGDIEISKIVQKRKPVEVLSRNPDGSLEYKKVTNWFCRVASPDELLLVETTAATTRKVGLVGHFPAKRRAIRCTSNHGFYTPSGKVPAGKLVPGDKIYSPGTSVSDWQKAMIIGGLLGDSYAFHKETATEVIGWPKTGGIVMSHGHEQIDYLDWKVSKLLNLWCSSEQRKLSAGGFAKTPGKRARLFKHPATTKIIKRFYIGGKKTVPAGIVSEMGWYGIGIWFADDGSVTRNHGKTTSYKIHTCGFSKGEVETLSQEMRDFTGLPWESRCRKNGNSVYYELVLPKGGRGGDNLSRWAEMLAPYLPPMMGYKINHALPVGSAWNDLLAVGGAWAEEVEVVSVTPYTKAAYESYLVFDITVEDNHNYFANGVLVSNSEVLKDARFLRAQENDEFWLSYMGGYDPKPPTRYAQYDRFMSMLRGAGLDPQASGSKTFLKPFGREKVRELTGNRVVTSPGTVDSYRGDKPISGGLMDPALFGNKDGGETWARIELDEPIPSPTFEEPIRKLLGLTKDRFRNILSGNDTYGTLKGPQAIVKALETYDLPGELEKARAEFASGRMTKRESAAKKMQYLKAAERLGVHPKDWVIDAVPVLPPSFRPVRRQAGGDLNVSDPNLLYADLLNSVTALKSLKSKVSDVGHERLTVYDATAAAYGLGQSVNPKYADKNLRGVLSDVFGDGSAKSSIVQQKLLGTPVNLSGRGVVLPNSDLDLDQIGVPADAAWDMYRPFIIRRMVRQGYPRVEALKRAEERDPTALSALQEEMKHRPVIATRYPVLHKYGSQAFYPVLVPGSSIQTNVLVNKGYTLDHDGDDQYNVVLVWLTRPALEAMVSAGTYTAAFFEDRDVTARFRTSTHVYENEKCYAVHLEDFPHGKLVGSKVGENGPIDFYEVPEGIKVLSFDESTGTQVLAPVSCWSVHKDRKVITVELSSGRQIVTDDDPRAVYGLDPNTLQPIRNRPKDAKGMHVPRFDVLSDTDSSADSGEVKFSAEVGYALGALVGNGWVTGNEDRLSLVCLACSDSGLESGFKAGLRKLSGKDDIHFTVNARSSAGDGGFGPSRRLQWANVEYADRLRSWIGRGAHNKHLPPFYLSGPRDFRINLLAGLIDTDGSVAVSKTSETKPKPQFKANYSTVSLRLAQEIQHLCRSLDIKASISPVKTPAGDSCWLVNFSGPDFVSACVPLQHSVKKQKLEEAPESLKSGAAYLALDMIPAPPGLMKAIRFVLPRSEYSYIAKLCGTKSIPRITRSKAEEYVAALPESFTHPLLERFRAIVANKSVTWDYVIGFTETDTVQTGFDLTVPGYETFAAADGVVLSNTMSMHVPLSAEAVENAKQTMLPSTNLRSMASFKPTMYLPNMEFQQGLHYASTADDLNQPIEFRTLKDAEAAFRAGKIGKGTRVRILEHKG